MDHIDLFPLLHNRLNRENQSIPEYIGEFDGVASLPKGEYPAIYYWVDRESHSSVRLSFNTPMLEMWCVEEALATGLNVDAIEPCVQQALATLQQLSSSAFEAMMNEMLNSECGTSTVNNSIETTPSKSKKWWQF